MFVGSRQRKDPAKKGPAWPGRHKLLMIRNAVWPRERAHNKRGANSEFGHEAVAALQTTKPSDAVYTRDLCMQIANSATRA